MMKTLAASLILATLASVAAPVQAMVLPTDLSIFDDLTILGDEADRRSGMCRAVFREGSTCGGV